MKPIGVASSKILQVRPDREVSKQDLLAVEEPLEILLGYGSESRRKEFSLSATMRTPGADHELVLGFLLSEGIIKGQSDVISVHHCQSSDNPENTIRVELNYHCLFDPGEFERHFLSNSSCGICGKAVIDHVFSKLADVKKKGNPNKISKDVLFNLSDSLNQHQSVYQHTGGMHAAAVFDLNGKILLVREDIGRHNALDKVVGAVLTERMNAHDKILWLSSRIGFELVQKALASGFNTVVALGAPSSLAVALAEKNQLTLIGFLSDEKFNIYCGKHNTPLDED